MAAGDGTDGSPVTQGAGKVRVVPGSGDAGSGVPPPCLRGPGAERFHEQRRQAGRAASVGRNLLPLLNR